MAKKTPKLDAKGYRKFGFRDCLAYAAGDLGCNMSFSLKGTVQTFWLVFMMMETGLLSVLLLIVQIWDAINDPIIGSMIDADRRNYKRGKFKTYILVGAIGLTVAGALVFIPAPNASVVMKAILFILGYVIWDACYTVANVPYGSMLSLVSEDAGERAQLSTWRSVGSMIGNILPMVLLPMLIWRKEVDANGNPILNPETGVQVETLLGNRVFVAALIMGVLGLIFFLFMIKNITIRVDENSVKTNEGGEKECAAVGALFSMIGGFVMFIFPLMANKTLSLVVYLVALIVFGLGMGVYTCVSWAFMADAIDYNEWKTGKREEGTIYSLHSFFRKLAQGVGPSIVLLIMGALGYVSELGTAGQSLATSYNMCWLVAALYCFSGVVMFLSIKCIYNIDKKTLATMNDELAARRAANNIDSVGE